MSRPERLCARCHQPVVRFYDEYGVFEQMHWMWFHLEFEHTGDADSPCDDVSYPLWHLEAFRQKLRDSWCDPDGILETAIRAVSDCHTFRK